MDHKSHGYDASVIKPIKRIDFGILSNDEIRAMSSMVGTPGIDIPELYDHQEPKPGGLVNRSMGASGNSTCTTCQFDTKNCLIKFNTKLPYSLFVLQNPFIHAL